MYASRYSQWRWPQTLLHGVSCSSPKMWENMAWETREPVVGLWYLMTSMFAHSRPMRICRLVVSVVRRKYWGLSGGGAKTLSGSGKSGLGGGVGASRVAAQGHDSNMLRKQHDGFGFRLSALRALSPEAFSFWLDWKRGREGLAFLRICGRETLLKRDLNHPYPPKKETDDSSSYVQKLDLHVSPPCVH